MESSLYRWHKNYIWSWICCCYRKRSTNSEWYPTPARKRNRCRVPSSDQLAKICSNSKSCHIICTDSRSVYEASKNINNCSEPIRQIQNILMVLNNSVKLMWIPGHAGITDNELADFSDHVTNPSVRMLTQSISTK